MTASPEPLLAGEVIVPVTPRALLQKDYLDIVRSEASRLRLWLTVFENACLRHSAFKDSDKALFDIYQVTTRLYYVT